MLQNGTRYHSVI